MKKILALGLALMMALSLAACGGKDAPKPSSESKEQPPAASRQTPDASTDTEAPSGSESTPPADADSTEAGSDESGLDESKFEWKDCALTEKVPKPTEGILTGSILMPGESQYTAKVMETTEEQAAAYLTAVKDAGWSGEETKQNGGFTFASTHENGTMLDLSYTGGLLNITLRPGEPTAPEAPAAGTYEGPFDEEWPDSSLTRLVPRPEFGTLVMVTENTAEEFGAAYKDATVESVKEYAEQLEKAGFTIDLSVMDGPSAYSFTAKNTDNYEVTVNCVAASSSLTILKL